MKLLLTILCTSVLFAGCKKDAEPTNNPNPIYNIPIDVGVEGLQDITMEQSDTSTLPITIKYISGTKEKVSIAFIYLPANMNIGITNQIDTPDYSTIIKFITNNADTGSTLVKLTTSASKSTKDFYFKINIIPNAVNPALALAGDYVENGQCASNANVNNPVNITAVTNIFKRIKIQGIWIGGNSFTIIADMDPVNKTIFIPYQQSGTMFFSGTGSYSNSQININYTVTDGAFVNDNCSTILTK